MQPFETTCNKPADNKLLTINLQQIILQANLQTMYNFINLCFWGKFFNYYIIYYTTLITVIQQVFWANHRHFD